jgi:hypothetical protein
MSDFHTLCTRESFFLVEVVWIQTRLYCFSSVLVHVLLFSGQVAGVGQDLIAKNSIVFPLPSASVVGST